MNKFKILSLMGGFLVGIPAVIVCIVSVFAISRCDGDTQLLIDNKPDTQTIDTIYVEKVVEKVKHDTIYIKTPTPQVKVETPKDTL